MSSHELTSHLHSFQSVSRFGTYASRLVAPAVQFPLSLPLSDLICHLSLCTSALQLMCEPCNVLQSGPRFDFLQLFFPFRNLCKSYSPLPSSSLWTYAAPLPSSPFLSFCCKSKLFKSLKDRITPHVTNFFRLRLTIEEQEGKRKYKSDGVVMVGEFVCMYVCSCTVSE